MAQNHLAEAVSPVPSAPQRAAQSTSWRLVVSDQGEPQKVTFIEPIVTELSWQANLSGVRRVTAGETCTTDGDLVLEPGLKPGTLVDETHFAVGEYPASSGVMARPVPVTLRHRSPQGDADEYPAHLTDAGRGEVCEYQVGPAGIEPTTSTV